MINYGFVSLTPIVHEVLAQFKKMNANGTLTEDDCYTYAVSCLKLIGYNIYQTKTEFIRLTNYRNTSLPKSLNLFEDVKLCVQADERTLLKIENINTTNQTQYFSHYVPMAPADHITLEYCKDCVADADKKTINFSYRREQRLFTAEVRNGIVRVTYNYLGTDENGDYVVLNEENCIKAVKAYMLQESLREDYLMGKIARYIWVDVQNDYNYHFNEAYNQMSTMGADEIEALIVKDRRRMDRFKIHRT
jgi:hypothetical protein